MTFIKQMLRDIEETKAGRIHRVFAHWELCSDEERDPGTYPIPGTTDAVAYLDRVVRISLDRQNRKMRLVRKRATFCQNPEYADRFANIAKEGNPLKLSVPETFCRKCRFYRSAARSHHRYATCGFVAVENPKLAAAQEFFGILNNAISHWKE